MQVPARSDLVASYCREICQRLGACPYLVCPTLYPAEGGCPASCNSRPKTEFHAAEQKLIKFRSALAYNFCTVMYVKQCQISNTG